MSEAAGIAGAGLGMIGELKKGVDTSQMANYNADTAMQNATIVRAQGAEEVRRSLVNSSKVIGSAEAAYGASGVTNDGSAQWVLRNSAAQGQLNALTIQNNANIRATAYDNEAALDEMRSSNAMSAANLGAAAALLGGATRMRGGGGGYSDSYSDD